MRKSIKKIYFDKKEFKMMKNNNFGAIVVIILVIVLELRIKLIIKEDNNHKILIQELAR